MTLARVYIIETDNAKHYYRNSELAVEFLREYCDKPNMRKKSLDGYMRGTNKQLKGIIKMSTVCLYKFLETPFTELYGDTLDKNCSKHRQKKNYILFDELYPSESLKENQNI
jgi:hypothetical protein